MIWVTERIQPHDTQSFGDVHYRSQRFGRIAVFLGISSEYVPGGGDCWRLESQPGPTKKLPITLALYQVRTCSPSVPFGFAEG